MQFKNVDRQFLWPWNCDRVGRFPPFLLLFPPQASHCSRNIRSRRNKFPLQKPVCLSVCLSVCVSVRLCLCELWKSRGEEKKTQEETSFVLLYSNFQRFPGQRSFYVKVAAFETNWSKIITTMCIHNTYYAPGMAALLRLFGEAMLDRQNSNQTAFFIYSSFEELSRSFILLTNSSWYLFTRVVK